MSVLPETLRLRRRPSRRSVDRTDPAPETTDNPAYPTRIWIYRDDNSQIAYNKPVTDGEVVSGSVGAGVLIRTSGPSEHDMRIKYDCRN